MVISLVRTLGLVVAAAALVSPCSAADPAYPVGGASIVVPAPAGFVLPGSEAPKLRELGLTMTAGSNRLLEIFVTPEDLAGSRDGRGGGMRRYFLVETLRQTEAQDIPVAGFAELKRLVRDQAQEYVKKVTPSAQQQISSAAASIGAKANAPELSIKLGETQIRGVIDETPASVSMLAVTKYAVAAQGKRLEVPMAIGMTTLLLRGKVVYFYVYSVIATPADLDWVQAQTKAWVPRAIASNR